ncbi:SgcJ/EcaC family oxidoreductase [Actinomycetospora aeridis]|uniref:SgcJ/EcaC family oxidoreductase n=1 Tax=Actinomycetospora aeridis TaxID=3129231 RepID=A0ABU8N2C6_9PSEU
MTTSASTLVDQAKHWADRYSGYTTGDEGAALTVPLRARVAWDEGDADAFADLFTDDGSMLIADDQLRGRDQIRAYAAEQFAGDLAGTVLVEEPTEIRTVAEGVTVAITTGGVTRPGVELTDGEKVRASYVLVRRDGVWKLLSHQTSPIQG